MNFTEVTRIPTTHEQIIFNQENKHQDHSEENLAEDTCIYMVRHGQTNFNKEDKIQGHSNDSPGNDINEKGTEEAHELAKKLSNVAFDHVFSSDLNRALQTCKIITKGREPVTDQRIRERDFKVWEGRQMTEFNANRVENWKQVESDESVRDRALEFLNEIGKEHKGKKILVVAHGGLMRNVLIRIFNLDCQVEDIKARNTSYYTLKYAGNWSLGKEREGIQFPEQYSESSFLSKV